MGKIWVDVMHYGAALALLLVGGLSELGVSLPGVVVSDPKTVIMAGVGVFAAGLKGGWTSK